MSASNDTMREALGILESSIGVMNSRIVLLDDGLSNEALFAELSLLADGLFDAALFAELSLLADAELTLFDDGLCDALLLLDEVIA